MRLILFAILLTLVYSWEDLVDGIRRFIHETKRRQHPFKSWAVGSDDFVTAAVMFFAVPLTLLYFLEEGSLPFKLGLIALELFAIAVLSLGIKIFNARLKYVQGYEGIEAFGAVSFAVVGLFSPVFRMFSRTARNGHELIAKFALYLSLPAFAAWFITLVAERDYITGEILPEMSSLLTVLTGSLFIIIAVNFLERHFRIYRYHILTYYRIILGIVLLFAISQGF